MRTARHVPRLIAVLRSGIALALTSVMWLPLPLTAQGGTPLFPLLTVPDGPPVDPNCVLKSRRSSWQRRAGSRYTAVQEQPGLKLERTRGALTVTMIDRIEKPAFD